MQQNTNPRATCAAPLFELNRKPDHGLILPVADATAVASCWQELEARCDSHFFHSWTWVGNWLELVLPHTTVYLYLHRRQGQVQACGLLTLCPARRGKGLIRTLQLQLNEYLPHQQQLDMVKGYGGLLMAEGDKSRCWSLFLETVRGFHKGWDEILLSCLPKTDYHVLMAQSGGLTPVEKKAAATWVRELPAPADSAEALEEALLEGFKKKSRKQLRQSLGAFARQGDIDLDRADSAETALQFFDAMNAVHTARWLADGKQGSFANPNWVAFHRGVIGSGFDKGQILMLRVRCGEMLLGYLYGHLYRNRVYMHQTGFALMDDNNLRPGYVSHFKAMALCAADGRVSYDFLPDREGSYKKFFVEKGPCVSWLLLQRPRLIFRLEKVLRGFRGYGRFRQRHKGQEE